MAGKRGFGSVRKLASGRHQARYTGPDGRSYPLGTFGTARQADSALAEVQREIDARTWVSPDAAPEPTPADAGPTVEEWATEWVRTLPSHTHRSHTVGRLRNHILPVIGSIPLSQLDRQTLRDWYAGCCLSYPTQRVRCYETMSAMLNAAVDAELIEVSPLRIKGATTVTPVREPQTASEEQLAALMAAMPAEERAAVLITAWCGLRVSEVLGLQRGDVAMDLPVESPMHPVVRLWLRRHVVPRSGDDPLLVGEDRGDAVRVERGTKGVESVEQVVVPDHILADVWTHMEQYVDAALDAWLFPAYTEPSKPLHPSTLGKHWRKAKRSVGLDSFVFHDLRRTGNTLAAESGATLAEMMQRLRHSTVAAAQRYLIASQGADVAVARRMSERARRAQRAVPTPLVVEAVIEATEAVPVDDRASRIAALRAGLDALTAELDELEQEG